MSAAEAADEFRDALNREVESARKVLIGKMTGGGDDIGGYGRIISVEEARAEYGLGGEDAIRREVEACEDEERERFRKKLAYWREHGAPAYHGPRAVS